MQWSVLAMQLLANKAAAVAAHCIVRTDITDATVLVMEQPRTYVRTYVRAGMVASDVHTNYVFLHCSWGEASSGPSMLEYLYQF